MKLYTPIHQIRRLTVNWAIYTLSCGFKVHREIRRFILHRWALQNWTLREIMRPKGVGTKKMGENCTRWQFVILNWSIIQYGRHVINIQWKLVIGLRKIFEYIFHDYILFIIIIIIIIFVIISWVNSLRIYFTFLHHNSLHCPQSNNNNKIWLIVRLSKWVKLFNKS